MGYVIDGMDQETDAEGYLLEANFSEEAVRVIAEADGITLTDDHWKVIAFMRDICASAAASMRSG